MTKSATHNNVLTRFARAVVLVINAAFFVLALIVLSLACSGDSHLIEDSALLSALSSLNLPLLIIVIIVAAACTIALSLVGFYASFRHHQQLLKFYVLSLFVVLAVQLAVSVYMLTLDLSTVAAQSWNSETSTAQQTRVDIQNALNCCGFNTWTDSIGLLNTPCPQMPALPIPFDPPTTCKQAIASSVNAWFTPVAYVALSMALVELITAALTVSLLFKPNSHLAYM